MEAALGWRWLLGSRYYLSRSYQRALAIMWKQRFQKMIEDLHLSRFETLNNCSCTDHIVQLSCNLWSLQDTENNLTFLWNKKQKICDKVLLIFHHL